MQRRTAAILFGAVFSIIVVADYVTKQLALAHLQLHSIPVIDGFASFRLAFNTGVAFSALDGIPHQLLGVGALVLLGVVMWSLRRLFTTLLGTVALALVAAGGIANAIDRLADGRVTDMISVSFWPVFNVADSAITIGVLLLFFSPRKDREETPAPAAEGGPPPSDRPVENGQG